jgi:hypothetical protein
MSRFKVIACEILYREVCHCMAISKNVIDPVFMEKGLHDIGTAKMSAKLQQEIDKTDKNKYEAVLLVYGLCNNGITGLKSDVPLVIPRAHDCITLLLGSKERYREYFDKNPGTYFHSAGWIERNSGSINNIDSIPNQLGMSVNFEELVEKYGEDNAKYVMEMSKDWVKNYKKYAFIDMGLGDVLAYRELTKKAAAERKWEFEELKGDVGLILKLMNGEWDEKEFLVLNPGKNVKASNDETIIKES